MSRTKVIGISGCTNSGKSTLCKLLAKELNNSIHISQDDYYRERNVANLEYIPEVESFNFDVITAIDTDKLNEDIVALRDSEQYDFILVDGFLIYADEVLASRLDKKYFILLGKEESRRRRETRNYKSMDTPDYFDKCVWVEYMKYLQFCQKKYSDIVYMDGTNQIPDSVEFLLSDLKRSNLIERPLEG